MLIPKGADFYAAVLLVGAIALIWGSLATVLIEAAISR